MGAVQQFLDALRAMAALQTLRRAGECSKRGNFWKYGMSRIEHLHGCELGGGVTPCARCVWFAFCKRGLCGAQKDGAAKFYPRAGRGNRNKRKGRKK